MNIGLFYKNKEWLWIVAEKQKHTYSRYTKVRKIK